ncbi:DEAD/DEAH box helicase [Janthinobacterium sp.]|uniref:DEAD/DEAH box helicase n=1 Tax=Janthinobacterium sp. TaxID=1871054 RepID=UPI00293D885A|nr:DEAD/DEAH box helicase [Janthinobacterium sp.]
MTFTADDIRLNFDSGTYGRGQDYERRGKVRTADLNEQRVNASVSGSGGALYRQSIQIVNGARGVSFKGSCTCPMTYNCKHVVAALLFCLRKGAAAALTAPPDGALPYALAEWLRTVARSAASQPAAARVAKTPKVNYRLIYVLMPATTAGGVTLSLCKARVRADGGVASASVLPETYSLRANLPDYFLAADQQPTYLFATLRSGIEFNVASEPPRGAVGAQLLRLLLDEGRLLWADDRAALKLGRLAPLAAAPARAAQLVWQTVDADDTLSLVMQFADGAPLEYLLPTQPALFLQGGEIGELILPEAVAAMPIPALKEMLAQAPRVAAADRPALARQLREEGLELLLPPPPSLRQSVRSGVVARPFLLLGSVDGFDAATHMPAWHDYALLAFDYEGMRASADAAQTLQRRTPAGTELIERDAAAEARAAAALEALGFAAAGAASPLHGIAGALGLAAPQAWLRFAERDLAALRAEGWLIEYGPDYRYDLSAVEDWYAEVDEGAAGNAWFELELGIVVKQRRVPLLPVLLQLIREAPQDFRAAALEAYADSDSLIVRLPDGARVALPWGRLKPILNTLGELYFSERIGAGVRLPVPDAARLAELEANAQLRWVGGQRVREMGQKLRGFGGVRQVAAPAGLRATLRGYQSEGLAWMQFLREYQFAGILADDMGLGKTLQTLAHILLEKEAGRLDSPALVVAPTSLMGNWQAEAARFAPDLRVLLLHGPERQARFADIGAYDLVLTTYALLPRDEAKLREQRFHLLILDESQYIKNSRSKAAQTAALLPAAHRLCLTGTPLQNHLGELWAQFHFLLPGLLGDEKSFNADFRKPIEKNGDQARNAFLIQRIKPFLLRRTKDKVATELPAKTEMLREVELAGAQRDLYETVRLAMDAKVREAIAAKGVARSQIVILEALLKLRQVCCDPRLVGAAGKKKSTAPSAKLAELMEMVEALLDEGRKILIFSQFTSMLALIEAELQARAIAYALLTGATKDRAAQVAAFQQGAVPLFLISLKAGGVGLNLTAADTVIHYDPWWNPAAENQATDRAWRIGQDKPVFVYKLIAKGTLEEKIQEMQRRKADLADALLVEGAAHSLAITQDDLQAIFAPL